MSGRLGRHPTNYDLNDKCICVSATLTALSFAPLSSSAGRRCAILSKACRTSFGEAASRTALKNTAWDLSMASFRYLSLVVTASYANIAFDCTNAAAEVKSTGESADLVVEVEVEVVASTILSISTDKKALTFTLIASTEEMANASYSNAAVVVVCLE